MRNHWNHLRRLTLKCKVVKVTVFAYKGKNYKPGDVVEVPKRFSTLDFLQPVKEESKSSEEKKSEKPEKKSEKPEK